MCVLGCLLLNAVKGLKCRVYWVTQNLLEKATALLRFLNVWLNRVTVRWFKCCFNTCKKKV